MRSRYILGTRGSSLAMCQAQIVQTLLEAQHPGTAFQVKTIHARADRAPEQPLVSMSGEGVFVKELEAALQDHEIDLAVHSLKDLPLQGPKTLCLGAILAREEPRDALVSKSDTPFDGLPAGARVGTSSRRRQSQLRAWRQDVELADIRGNVDTRLRKLDEGRYDAVVVAACGLIRLGLEERITEYLPTERMLPEPGQGALAIEVREDDADVRGLVAGLDDARSRACVEAERALLGALGGGCHLPIAGLASCGTDTLTLEGAVIAVDGRRQVRSRLDGPLQEARAVGERLGQILIRQGALDLLNEVS